MEKELIKLWDEFEKYVDNYNRSLKSPLEDDISLSFANFILWLKWEKSPN